MKCIFCDNAFFNAARKVSKKLEKSLKVKLAKKRIFYNKYEGYLTTRLGPKAEEKKLEQLAEKIR